MCSSRFSGKEFYSGLENRISLKRTWWRDGRAVCMSRFRPFRQVVCTCSIRNVAPPLPKAVNGYPSGVGGGEG